MYLVDFRILKQIIILILLAVIPLAVAVIGALITDAEGGLIILSVEMLSSRSIMVLERTAGLLPLGIAFAAGMVATVNPCGFPMLPTYLLMYLGSGDDNRIGGSIGKRLWNALIVGTVVSSGFTVLFGLAGLIIGAGVYILVDAMPWIGLAVGTLLTLVGSWLLVGGKLYSMTALNWQIVFGINRKSMFGVILYMGLLMQLLLSAVHCPFSWQLRVLALRPRIQSKL